ncbi:MAG: hypothetical protein AMS25_03205 [Gemmatimonas sp. SM23_52]|nr:MAG: hypothetical protein AMS25_03205 [Gemmatimonas sp. SM23_52]
MRRSAIDVAWRQWCAVGSLASIAGEAGASALVDPEALILFSLALRDDERRLWDVLTWWARTGVGLLSVQRIKKLAREYPPAVQGRLAEFAWYAVQSGDKRWQSLSGTGAAESRGPEPRRDKWFGEGPELIEPAALLLRLRAGFGVGAKADLLEDMARARLVHASGNKPVEFRVNPKPWSDLLELPRLSPWRYWQPLYAFLMNTLAWVDSDGFQGGTDYLVSSKARDLVIAHRAAFTRNGIDVPRPEDFKGESYLTAFAGTLRMTGRWLARSV